mgnify:FL=1
MRRIVSQRERNEYWQRTAALPQLLADAIDQGVLSDWVKENPNWLKSLGKDPGFADAVKKNVGPSWAQLQNILVNFAMNHDEFAPLAYGALDASKKQMADKYWGQETTPPDWWHPKKAIAKPKDQTLKQLLAKPGLTDTELYDWLDKHPKVDNALKNPDDPAHEGVLSELADKLAPFLSPTNYPAVHEYATPSDPDYKTLLQNNDEYTDVDPAKLKTPEFKKWWSQLSQGQKNYFADQPAEALDEQTNFFGEGGFLDTPESIANTSVDDVMDLLHTPNSPAPGAIDYSEDVDPHEPQVLSTGLGHSTSFNKWVKDHGLADSASQLYTEDLTAYQKACEEYKQDYAAGYDKVPPWKPETVINFLKSQGWPENSSGFETLKAYPEMIEENLKTWKSNAAAQAALQKFFPQGGPETNADQPYTPTTFKTKGMPGHTPAWMGSGKQQGEADEQGNYFYEISPGMDAWLQAKGVTPEEVNSWPLNDSLKKEWQALSHSQKDAWAAYETGGASPGASGVPDAFATETKTLGQKLHELEPVMDAAKIDAMDPVKQMEVLNKIYSPQSSDPVSQAAQKVIEQHFGIGHLKEGPPLTKKPPSGSQQTFPGMSQTELHHDMPGSASWNVLHDRAKRDRSFGPQDMGLIEDPEFRKWFESAPADYRSVYQHHPAIALDDYGIAQKGGPAYGPVPQGDQGMEYQLDMTPTTTYKKDVEGYPYWPGWTKNPEASSGAGRPKNKWEDDAELLSGQGEIPLPPGSTWVPGQKQKLHRGLNLNLNYWNNRRQSHDGLTPAEEEQAAKLDAIAKIWRGSSEFDLLHPQPEGWAENVPFTSVPSGGKGALDFASWALKNRIPPEQMYDLAESWGLPGDDYGPRPSKTQIPANPMHPDLGNMVLDYIENNPKTWEYVPHGIQSGIGPHWSTKEDVSKHSFASNNATKDNIPVVVSGDWTGRGEDPDRPHGANGYPSEHEITLAPGGQVAINRVQFQAPHTGEWHEVPVTPHVRAASLSHSPLDKVLETR